MRVASVCSSVGGLDLGLHRAGHSTVFFCEFEPWRRKVLARHWPGVPVHHDLKELDASDIPACDLLVGGTPCQDLSVAGNRAGLDGERSGLFHAFAQLRLDLFERHGCAWSLWENVAGALSSNEGRDFATVLASHVGADVAVPAGGWGGSGVVVGPWGAAEWRLLDAQFVGVPQRRRRVFVVGHLGAVHAPAVLADTARRSRHPEAREGARADASGGVAGGSRVAGTLGAVGKGGGGLGIDRVGAFVTGGRAFAPTGSGVSHTLTGNGYDASEDGTGRGTPLVASALDASDGGTDAKHAQANHLVASTLTSGSRSPGQSPPGRRTEDDRNIVAFRPMAVKENDRAEVWESELPSALSTGGGKPGQGYAAVRVQQGVRRLTPTECERLMGWPDGWTLDVGPSLVDAPQGWPSDLVSPVDPKPDGRRYSACGDGVVAHVAEWIGLALAEVE